MRITFELIGGPLNGIYSGELAQSSTVLAWYHASNQGRIGNDFTVELPVSNSQTQQCRYRVTGCSQRDGTIQIAAAFEE
jgi:hypothetical protein